MSETILTLEGLWKKWNIRLLIFFSLSLQMILVFFAPNRKRTSGKIFVFLIWFAYLLADWSANFTIGQISDTQNDGDEASSHELLALWAPFLLLHLGGPDTITALALEDNELWRRHLFGLICQALSTLYVLFLSIPSSIFLPTVLMIVAGVIKFIERIRALYLASSGKFKGSIFRKHERLMRKGNLKTIQERFNNIPSRPNRELRDLEIVQYAYKLFNISKGLVPDLRLASRGWDESKSFFYSLNPEEALGVLEVELSLMYDDFFTKASVLLTRVGSIFRFIAMVCLVSTLYIFLLKKKDDYERFDVILTYALLVCGIGLELVVILMVCLSDRTIAITRKLKENPGETCSWFDRFLNWILCFRRLKWKKCRCHMNEEDLDEVHKVLDRTFMFRRWSEYINGYNLIEFCLRINPKKIHRPVSFIRSFFDLRITRSFALVGQRIYSCFASMEGGAVTTTTACFMIKTNCRPICILYIPLFVFLIPFSLLVDLLLLGIEHFLEFFGVQDEITEMIFKSKDRLSKDLWEFIHKELRYKSGFAVDRERAKRISSARGEWTLSHPQSNGESGLVLGRTLLQYVTLVDYGQSILLWHIATDIIYHTEMGDFTEEQFRFRELSKMLSDYMLYLMMMKPALMSAVAGTGKMKFTETCSVARTFFGDEFVDVKEACKQLLSNERNMMVLYMGDESTLEDACKLAEELLRVERRSGRGGSIWGLVSRVWVEMLCYAANQCDSKQHVAQLSQGGELVSFVWLFMAHLGIGKHATMHHQA